MSSILLFLVATVATVLAVQCFNPVTPAYIQEITPTGDAKWQSVVTNAANTNVYTAGYTSAVGLFSSLSSGKYPFAANYEVSTGRYLWAKVYLLQGSPAQFDAVSLKSDSSVLALAGSFKDYMSLFVYLVDPDTGSQLYPYFTIGLDFKAKLLNEQSILFTAGSRLYLAPEVYREPGSNQGGNRALDGSQFATVKFVTEEVTLMWQKHSQLGVEGGTSANLINVFPNAPDGSEKVFSGGGLYITDNGISGFVLALNQISPVDGSISQIQFKYDVGGSLFQDELKYHIFGRTKVNGLKLTAVTRSAQEHKRGSQTYYCVFTFADNTFTTLDMSSSTNNACKRQDDTVAGYSESQIVLDYQFFLQNNNEKNLHLISFDVDNSYLTYNRVYVTNTNQNFDKNILMAKYQYAEAAVITPNVLVRIGTVNVRSAKVVGGTSSFEAYTSPIAHSYLMPFITDVLVNQTCSNFDYQGLFGSNLDSTDTHYSIYELINLTALSATFQSSQTFIDSTQTLTYTTAFVTKNLNFALTKQNTLCNSYPVLATAPGSFPNQIVYLSHLNTSLTCSFTSNNVKQATCAQPNVWSYSIDESALGLSYDVFTVNSATNQISIVLKDQVLAEGDYPITVVGILPNLQRQSFQFYLSVVAGSTMPTCATTPTCATSIFTEIKLPKIADQAYTVGQQQRLTGVIPTLTSTICTTDDVTLTVTVTPRTFAQDPTFITLNQATGVITFYSISNSDSGVYDITITGAVADLRKTQMSQSFTLTVSPQTCADSLDVLYLAPTVQFNILYLVNSADSTTQLLPFTQSSLFCAEEDIEYSIIVTSNGGQSTAFIELNKLELSYFTTMDTGIYTVQLAGTLTNAWNPVTTSTSFQLIITQLLCLRNTTTVATSLLPNIEYTVGTIYMDNLLIQDNVNDACAPTWQYSLLSKYDVVPSFITFNGQSRLIRIESYTPVACTVELFLSVKRNNQQFAVLPFNLTIVLPANSPPVLEGFTQDKYIINDMTTNTIMLGPIVDPDFNQTVTSSYIVVPTSRQISFDFETGQLKIDSQNVKVGEYFVRIKLQDNFMLNLGVTVYTIYLTKLPDSAVASTNSVQDKNATLNNTEKVPYFSKMTFDRVGLCTVYFSELLEIPSNYTLFNSSNLQLKFTPPFSADPQWLQFNWTCVEYNPAYMQLQIKFKDPLYVSSKSRDALDHMQLTVVNPANFTSKKGIQMLNLTNISQSVLAQFYSENEARNLNEIISVLQYITTVIVVGTVLNSFFVQGLLRQLLDMLNALQLVVYLQYLNVFMPANAQAFFQFLMDLAAMNIIPTQTIFASLFPYFPSLEHEDSYLTALFAQLQVLILACCVILAAAPLLLLCYLLRSDYAWLGRVYNNVKNHLMWNESIRFVLQSYLSFTLFLVCAIDYTSQLQTTGNYAVLILASIVLIFYAVIPLALTLYFRKHLAKFRQKTFLDKFKEIIGGYDWRVKQATFHISLFCYRRLIQVAVIELLSDYAYAQVVAMSIMSAVAAMVFGWCRPFIMPGQRRLEYFNESFIIICVCHYFLLTDFVDNPPTRYFIGYSLIASCLANTAVNISFVVRSNANHWIQVVRRKKAIYVKKKQIKKLQLERQKARVEQKQKILEEKAAQRRKFILKRQAEYKEQQEQKELQLQRWQQEFSQRIRQQSPETPEFNHGQDLGATIYQQSQQMFQQQLDPSQGPVLLSWQHNPSQGPVLLSQQLDPSQDPILISAKLKKLNYDKAPNERARARIKRQAKLWQDRDIREQNRLHLYLNSLKSISKEPVVPTFPVMRIQDNQSDHQSEDQSKRFMTFE